MIAMQYNFTLPADYDMGVIDRRIHDRGRLTDGFLHLRFKAYLSARRQDGSAANLYAPFYLWQAPEGMVNFLSGPGFATAARDFGWPVVQSWMVWEAALGDLAAARFASRDIRPIQAYADLAVLRAEASQQAQADAQQGALASVTGFDPAGWNCVRFRLWRNMPPEIGGQDQLYAVGHVSLP